MPQENDGRIAFRDAEIARLREALRANIAERDRLAKQVERSTYLLYRCYKAGHREGWDDGESNSEVFDAVNNYLADVAGSDWGDKLDAALTEQRPE